MKGASRKKLVREIALAALLSITTAALVLVFPKETSAEAAHYIFNDERKPGTHGRFIIPDLEIDVGLNDAYSDDSQEIVDREDSAAYIQWTNHIAIVDHGMYPFVNLVNAQPNETLAYIVDCNQPQKFICKDIEQGYTMENYQGSGHRVLFDLAGEQISLKAKGTMITYCCLSETDSEGRTNVILVYWDTA